MDTQIHTDVTSKIRRVELFARAGEMESAKREAVDARSALAEAHENGLFTPAEASRLAARLESALRRS